MWISTFPLPFGAKKPPPIGATGHAEAAPDDIERWGIEAEAEGVNVGGRLSPGYFGIDIDNHDGRERGFESLSKKNISIPLTLAITSHLNPRDGVTVIVKSDTDEELLAGSGASIDRISHSLRYAVLPPSIHPSGARYNWGLIEIRAGAIVRWGTIASTPYLDEFEALISYTETLPEIYGVREAITNENSLFTDDDTDGEGMCLAMARTARIGAERIRASRENGRHRELVLVTWAIVTVARGGHRGFSTASKILRGVWNTKTMGRDFEFTAAIDSAKRRSGIKNNSRQCRCSGPRAGTNRRRLATFRN